MPNGYFDPLPRAELDLDYIKQWIQNNTDTFHRFLSLKGFSLTATGSHISLIESGSEDAFNIDVVGDVARFRWLNAGVANDRILVYGPDHATKANDIEYLSAASSITMNWDNSADTWNLGKHLVSTFSVRAGEHRTTNGPDSGDFFHFAAADGGDSAVLQQFDSSAGANVVFYKHYGVGSATTPGETVISAPGGTEKLRVLSSGINIDAEPAYLYKETVIYSVAGANTFTKSDYPGMRAARIKVQGGGGAGGSCALTGSDQWSGGGGGSGGGYAESWVLASDIDTTEAVTVGAGGTPGAAGANNGGAGADSVFDTISGEVRGVGGEGGGGSAAIAGAQFTINVDSDGSGGTGDLVVAGGDGERSFNRGTPTTCAGTGGFGGESFFGKRQRPDSAANAAGLTGNSYGGGGSGGHNSESQAAGRAGGAGGPGIVIVDVYV